MSTPDFDTAETIRKLFAGPCDFMRGIQTLDHLPGDEFPEIAFAGRSNVGKSSLINALTGRKTLARTSNTPGRTQQLNFFKLGSRMFLVDMPGYGYAEVSKADKKNWERLVRDYLRGRPNLRCVFILVDSRHGMKDSDDTLMGLLDEAAVAYRVVLTKADKISRDERDILIEQTSANLAKHTAAYPIPHITSSLKNDGIVELRTMIWNLTEE